MQQHIDPPPTWPVIIQGGMGVGVSGWQLARAVARRGHLGVISGVGCETTLARRLQDGDPDGSLRAAMAAFPVPGVADDMLVKLCAIAMSGDRGIDSRFDDFEFKLGKTIAEGHPVCEVQFLRKK